MTDVMELMVHTGEGYPQPPNFGRTKIKYKFNSPITGIFVFDCRDNEAVNSIKRYRSSDEPAGGL